MMQSETIARRALWIRRTGLLTELETCGENHFALKLAETLDEMKQSFSLVYEEYVRSGYLERSSASQLLFSIHHFLPGSSTYVIRNNQKVVSTLSLILDNKLFGLPMDSLYGPELMLLRAQGRRLCEACALATSGDFRWKNLFISKFRKVYWDAMNSGSTDMCIMVNPKHAPFYKGIFLFEDLGPERLYPRLGAPAVALRMNLGPHGERLKEAYAGLPADQSLYHFFYGDSIHRTVFRDEDRFAYDHVVRYFYEKERKAFEKLSEEQMKYFFSCYPSLNGIH